jgi:hypothetical protein
LNDHAVLFLQFNHMLIDAFSHAVNLMARSRKLLAVLFHTCYPDFVNQTRHTVEYRLLLRSKGGQETAVGIAVCEGDCTRIYVGRSVRELKKSLVELQAEDYAGMIEGALRWGEIQEWREPVRDPLWIYAAMGAGERVLSQY